MSREKREWRYFGIRIDNNDSIITHDNFEKVQTLMTFLDDKMNELLNDMAFAQIAMKNIQLYGSNFFKAIAEEYGKPYLQWNISVKERYNRIILVQIQNNLKSLAEKFAITDICEQHNWDTSKKELELIHEEINNTLGHFVSTKWIKNICKSKAYPTIPTHLNFELNYTSADTQVCKIVEQDNEYIKYSMRMADGTDAILNIPIPNNIRKNTGHFSNPKIRIKFNKIPMKLKVIMLTSCMTPQYQRT